MTIIIGRGTAIAVASIVAGPIFVLSFIFFAIALSPGEMTPFEPTMAVALLIFLVYAAVIGAFLSVIPNLAGTLALSAVGEHYPLFREPLIWAGTGAAMGMALLPLFGFDYANLVASQAAPFIATSAFCALICRCFVHWRTDCY